MKDISQLCTYKWEVTLSRLLHIYTTSTAVRCKPGMFSNKSTVSMEALGRAGRLEYAVDKGTENIVRSQVLSHLACMYLCFRHGPKCIFFSFMHILAAEHKILIKDNNLSILPTNTSGSLLTSWLYSSLALAISNSARKLNSIITLTSFLAFVLSITSKKVCSPAK